MKRLLTILCLVLLPMVAWCQSVPAYSNNVYFDRSGVQFGIESSVWNTPEMHFYLYEREGVSFTATGYTALFMFSTNSYSRSDKISSMAQITGTVMTNYVVFAVDSNDFNVAVQEGYAVIRLTSGAQKQSYAHGKITLALAPEIASGTNLFTATAIDWSTYGPHSSVTNYFPLIAGTHLRYRAYGANGQYYIDVLGGTITNLTAANLVAGTVATAIDINAATNANPASFRPHRVYAAGDAASMTNVLATAFRAGSVSTAIDGNAITNLSAANLAAATVATAIDINAATNANPASFEQHRVYAAGDGAAITNLSAANIEATTVITAIDGAAITNLTAANLAAGGVASIGVTNSTHLGAVAAAEYFRRDGSVAMTGDIDMDNNDLMDLGTNIQSRAQEFGIHSVYGNQSRVYLHGGAPGSGAAGGGTVNVYQNNHGFAGVAIEAGSCGGNRIYFNVTNGTQCARAQADAGVVGWDFLSSTCSNMVINWSSMTNSSFVHLTPTATAATVPLQVSGTNSAGLSIRTTGEISAGGNITLDGTFLRCATALEIESETTDGSDNQYIQINGGGDGDVTRGARIWIGGNEHATFGGVMHFHMGRSDDPTKDFGVVVYDPYGVSSFRIHTNGYLHVGSTGTTNYITGNGDLYVLDDIEFDGDIYGSGAQLTAINAANLTAGTVATAIDASAMTNGAAATFFPGGEAILKDSTSHLTEGYFDVAWSTQLCFIASGVTNVIDKDITTAGLQ